jgi:4-alpha-glucanotransferase
VAPRISLALAIHNHQPVGNFGWVFAEVYDAAYLPMLAALERHPGVKLSLHYTGPLLEWVAAERPAFLRRLQQLVMRGQVELLGGGLYEPVLASLPEHDRVDQLVRMADTVERIAGVRPRGAWLAERVWEPDLPTSLEAAGYTWTILDDAHFRAAAIPEENLWGTYTTDDQGRILTVFGTEQGLRYRIPFGSVEDVIAYLREHATEAGDRVGMMGDDGEKFGAWPTTYEHCWGSGRWVDRFFEALEENADWLTTVTPSQWLEREPPIGRVYVPTSSYAEMGEWALPADEGLVYTELLHRAVAERRPEARWLRGGFWRNFQVKYREINDLHKQMLRTSAKVAAMPAGPIREAAMDHLHRGQSNDCYWHGLFGGIYISHMRLATYEHLIAAEDLADSALVTERVGELRDLDLDGILDAQLAGPGQVVAVKLNEGAGIGSWDIRASRHALAAVMRRRPEAYHETLRAHEAGEARDGAPAGGSDSGTVTGVASGSSESPHPGADESPGEGDGRDGPASIHDIVNVKEPGLASRLHYDDYERRSGLVRFLAPTTGPTTFANGQAVELGDLRDGAFTVVSISPERLVARRDGTVLHVDGSLQPVTVTKTIELSGGRLDPALGLEVEILNTGSTPIEARLGIEWAFHLLGGGGNPAAWYEVGGTRTAHDADGQAEAVERLAAGNDWVGVTVETAVSPPADAWWSSIDTISNSEGGFERVYQGSALLLSWPVRIEPGALHVVRVDHRAVVARDHGDPAPPSPSAASEVPV